MEVKIKKLHEDAVVPFFATKGAAGFDLVALEYAVISKPVAECIPYVNTLEDADFVYIDSVVISTGLAFEIPEGYELEVRSRSGLGFKQGVLAFNGTVDSDYRGEVKIKLFNLGENDFLVEKGMRIAQGIIKKIEQVKFVEVDELSSTDRGEGGFNSTGLK